MQRLSICLRRCLHPAVSCSRPLRLFSRAINSNPVRGLGGGVLDGQRVPKFELRGYQEECIRSVLSSLAEGHKRLGISLATGSGKTVIFTQLIGRMSPPNETATQTIILVHRRELVEQAARHCILTYPEKVVEIEMGDLHASGTADITVASIQSVISGDRIDKFDPARFKLVLVDEAHHIVSPSYLRVLEHFRLRNFEVCSPALVGVSATMSRFDGLRLGAALDRIVYHKDYIDMIGEKWLSDVIFTTVQTKTDLRHVAIASTGDFSLPDLSRKIDTPARNELIVRTWLARAKARKSTLVFCVDLTHLNSLTNEFRKRGIDARFVTGKTRKKLRAERLDAFRNEEFPVLLNCGVFTEGTDIPNIDCVLLARPTRSRNLLVQMIGRGMRLSKGKTNCHIIDFVTVLQTGIVSTPTLFGLDPGELIDESNAHQLKELQQEREEEQKQEEELERERESEPEVSVATAPTSDSATSPLNTTVSMTDYDSVEELIEDTSGERYIRSISQLAWVQVDDARYILTGKKGDFLSLQKNSNGHWTVHHTPKIPVWVMAQSFYGRPRQVATAETFIDAVHAADTFGENRFEWMFIYHKMGWRKKPASRSQLAVLNRLRSVDMQLTPDQITKGRAGDMITKLKFGAKSRFTKLQAKKRRDDREHRGKERADELRRREEVKVGPLEA